MIVLDATSKSLIIRHQAGLPASVIAEATVSYWSVDSSNVWTPHSNEATLSGTGDTIILPAPVVGETRVVENIWIFISRSAVNAMLVMLDTSSTLRAISNHTSPPLGTVITLSRDGRVDHAAPTTGPVTTVTQSVR